MRGRVVDSSRSPIVGAQVQLFDEGKKLPFDFRSTNGRGSFSFRIKQTREIRLEIRAMGREDFAQTIDLKAAVGEAIDLGDILLQPHFEEINEVHVEAEKSVVRRGDTVAFRVGAFAKGGEKNLEEVIKQMPGMKVESDGKIRYLGREIEKVMVGGVDMFGRNYQMLTKNLDPTAVHEVQVLEHFEENRLMRKHRSSERVAMNLALKPGKGQLIGTLRAAYGYRNVHDAQLSLTGIFNKLQLNVLANSNQVGVSPAASAAAWQSPLGLRNIAGGEVANLRGSGSGLRLSPLVGVQGAQAPLANARRRRNMSHMLSAAMVYTPSSKFRMNVSGVGQLEDDCYDSRLISDWNFDNQTIHRDERSHRALRTLLAGGRLTLEGQASEVSDLRYDGGYSTIGDKSVAEGEHGESLLHENADTRWHRMDHTLLYTHSFDSAGLLRGGVEWQSQWLNPSYTAKTEGPVPLGFTTHEGIAAYYKQAMHTGSTRWVYFAPSFNGLTGDVRLGASYSQHQLGVTSSLVEEDSYAMRTFDAYAGGAISYTYRHFKAVAVLLGHATQVSFTELPREEILDRWVYFPEPQLALQLSKNEHLAVVSYGYNTAFSSLVGLLPRPVFTNFRTTMTGAPAFRLHYGHAAMAYYSYGIPTSRFTADASVSYNFTPNPSVQHNVVAANRTMVYVIQGKQSDRVEGSVNCDIFMPSIVTNIKLSVQAAQGRFAQYINDAVLDVRSRSIFAGLSVRTNVRRILDLQLGANWSTVCLDSDHSRSLHHDMAQFIEAQLFIRPVRVVVSADRIEVGLKRGHENAIYFLDASIECEIFNEKLSCYVEGRNLLNYRYYSQRTDSNVETVQMRYEIPAIQALAGLRWKF